MNKYERKRRMMMEERLPIRPPIYSYPHLNHTERVGKEKNETPPPFEAKHQEEIQVVRHPLHREKEKEKARRD